MNKCYILLSISAIFAIGAFADRGEPRFYKKCEDFGPQLTFKCKTNEGMCISSMWRCDSKIDCLDGSDEDPAVCAKKHNEYCDTGFEGKILNGRQLEKWQCADGMCIEKCRVCDDIEDCYDESDESKEKCSNEEFQRELEDVREQCGNPSLHTEL